MRTRARRVACVVFEELELLDLAAVLGVLTSAGRRWNFRPFKIELCSTTPGLLSTRNQLRIEAPGALATAAPAEVLVVLGGYGARAALREPELLAAVHRLGATAEIVAAIGWGVPLIASAGLTGGAKVAAPSESWDTLRELARDPELKLQTGVIAEGRLLTASGTAFAVELALKIIALALGEKMSASVANELGVPPPVQRIDVRY